MFNTQKIVINVHSQKRGIVLKVGKGLDEEHAINMLASALYGYSKDHLDKHITCRKDGCFMYDYYSKILEHLHGIRDYADTIAKAGNSDEKLLKEDKLGKL